MAQDLVVSGFPTVSISSNLNRLFFVKSPKPLSGKAHFKVELRQLCRLEHGTSFRLVDVRFISEEERREHARQEWERREKSKHIDELFAEMRASPPPGNEDIAELLRAKWTKYEPHFQLDGSTFTRVRDVACEWQTSRFVCQVGILAMTKRGPEYERAELEFRRVEDDPTGRCAKRWDRMDCTFELVDPEIFVVN